MRITWITRSFLDYRIPVYQALDELCNHELTVIYYKGVTPVRVQEKLKSILGERAIGRENELRIGNGAKRSNATEKVGSFRIPISFGLIRQVLKTQPEVMISDGFMQWTYAPLFIRSLKKIPHVMCYERTAHMERNAGVIRKLYRKFVSRWIDVIDCNGKLCAEYVNELVHFNEDRITYGHMVADVKGMAEAVKNLKSSEIKQLRKNLNVRGIMILYVGRLIALKGVMQLLNAWAKTDVNMKATLVYVGGGPLEKSLRERIKNENINNVYIAGAVDYDSIALYYGAADAFILPTTGDNWSLVIPEAMACSLPVATTIYNGCYPELITDKNGWTFDSLNQDSIVSVLQDIVDKHDKLKIMGEESLRIASCHTAPNAAEGIIEAINKARKRIGIL